MKNKKLKAAIYIGTLLWVVAFVQMGITRILYTEDNFSQAFARNQLEVVSSKVELKAKIGKEDKNRIIQKEVWEKEFGENTIVSISNVNAIDYLHALIDTNADTKNMSQTKKKLSSFLNKMNYNDYQLHTIVECQYKGKMTQKEKQSLTEKLFKQYGAMILSNKEDNNYFVAYGYTLGEQDSITINGKKVNLNLAITYDEEKGVSRIFLGTPLIQVDF